MKFDDVLMMTGMDRETLNKDPDAEPLSPEDLKKIAEKAKDDGEMGPMFKRMLVGH